MLSRQICKIYLENSDTQSILNILSPRATGQVTTLPVARPAKPALSIALVFQYQRVLMLSINAHAVSLSLHFLASDAFSPSNATLGLFSLLFLQ